MTQLYKYRAFGLNILCEWHIFQLPEHVFNNADVDVTIVIGEVVGDDFDLTAQAQHFQVRGQSALIKLPDVANFLISDGNKIVADINDTSDMQTVNLYMLGSALGTILHQRGNLPLHGNSININERAVLVVAHSGVGKSTLASEFCRLGYALLSDDVCALDNHNMIHPSYPYLKLWQDTVEHFGLETEEMIRITAQREKYYVPLKQQFQTSSLPLNSIYIVTRDESLSAATIARITGLNKLLMLRPHIYRLGYLRELMSGSPAMERMFEKLAKTPIFHIKRPLTGMHVEKIANLILENENR